MKIFIVYGGREGEGYGITINNYFKQNKIDSFLASRTSPDVPLGTHSQDSIDENLSSAEIVIIIITPELDTSDEAMTEIRQIFQLSIPFIPYRRKESNTPALLLSFQEREFDPARLDGNELKELEIQMWRKLEVSRISVARLSTTQPIGVSYIG